VGSTPTARTKRKTLRPQKDSRLLAAPTMHCLPRGFAANSLILSFVLIYLRDEAIFGGVINQPFKVYFN
jgi:hypothetical protein